MRTYKIVRFLIVKNLVVNILIAGIFSLTPAITQAAQLIDKIPTALIENWSICIQYEQESSVCQNQSTADLPSKFDKKIDRINYKKKFIISSDLQSSTIAIWLHTVDDVDEVKINGHLIGKTGRFPPYFQSGFRHQRLYLIPSTILKYNQFNYLEINTFSSINTAGLKKAPVVIGEYFSMAQTIQRNDYVYIISIAVFLLLTVFQLFYYFMVKGNNETLYLSLYLISFAIVAFARSQMPLQMGYNLSSTFKIEMFLISVSVTSFSFFVFRFFDLEVRRPYVIGILIMALPGLLIITFPDPLQTRMIAEYGYWIICVFTFFTAGSAVVISVHKKCRYSLIIGSFCTLGWLAFCFDAISQSSLFIELNLSLRPSSLLIANCLVGICMSLAITHKYWQLFKGATYDHLTGTLLRPAFFQRLSEEIQRSQQDNSLLFVAVIHIQEVKKISASYGHGVHNNMLVIVSDIISKNLKPLDLICHFNDDEFCIVARVESKIEADNYLQRIHQDLSSTQQQVGTETELFIDAKLGGIIYNPDQHLSVSQLLQDANYGLEKAKNHSVKDYILLNNPTVMTSLSE